MSTLCELLKDYLTTRRALGFQRHTDGTGLLSFVALMERAHAEYISTDLALTWARLPTSAQPAWWAHRLCYVRGFAHYCRAIDPRTEVPPLGLLPFTHQRPSPYFFTNDDIDHLLQGALTMPAQADFTNHALYCLFGLLSVSGLRICEVLGLTLDDLQAQRGIGARSRNLRLTAIRSFYRYAAFELPERAEPIQRILAIPCKRYLHKQIP